MKWCVALDFDGTLWDSVHECFVMTLEAFKRLEWTIPAPQDLEERFVQGRPFVKVGWEFYTLMKWIEENPDRDPTSMSALEEATLHTSSEEAELFEAAFYALRKEWRETRFEEWCALQEPYPGVLEQIELIRKNFSRVVIATTKDAGSVHKLLGVYGITFDVVGKEKTVDKSEQMKWISQKYGIALPQIVFVDDLLEQIIPVRSLGVIVALAGWGYNLPRHREEATKLGVPVLKLETLAETLGLIL